MTLGDGGWTRVALLLATLLATSRAYYISVDANEEQCYFDRVTAGTKMGLMFEVCRSIRCKMVI